MTRNRMHLHATVRGKVHVRENLSCEDASGSMEIPKADGFAFVVADGHGDRACSRSAIGSRVAVDTALECLRDVAHEARRISPGEVDADAIGSNIVQTWRSRVLADLKTNPLSDDEWEQLGERGQRIADARPEHLYGTTLVAGLLLPHMLLLLQQGDGSCVVLDERGEFLCPIPEDDRCMGNVTSSMCDRDAAEHIRCLAIARDDLRPIACFVGTDGIDKSFVGSDGLYNSCAELLLELRDTGDEETLLAQWIGDLSAHGSGDDASLAVYVDMDAVKRVDSQLKHRMALRKRGEELAFLQDKVISMQRRSEYYMRTEPASEDERVEREQYLNEYRACLERIQELEETGQTNDAEGVLAEQLPLEAQPSHEADPEPADEPEYVPDASPKAASAGAPSARLKILREDALHTRDTANRRSRTQPPKAEVSDAKWGNRRSILLLVSIAMSVLALLAVIALCIVLFSGGSAQEAPPPADSASQTMLVTSTENDGRVVADSSVQPSATSSEEQGHANPPRQDADHRTEQLGTDL